MNRPLMEHSSTHFRYFVVVLDVFGINKTKQHRTRKRLKSHRKHFWAITKTEEQQQQKSNTKSKKPKFIDEQKQKIQISVHTSMLLFSVCFFFNNLAEIRTDRICIYINSYAYLYIQIGINIIKNHLCVTQQIFWALAKN